MNSNYDLLADITGEAVLKELSDNAAKKCCLQCGAPLPEQTGRGRPHKYCSIQCGNAWRSHHLDVSTWPSARLVVCPQCGKEFYAARECPNPRKYCSHACANKARAGQARKKRSDELGSSV